MTVKDPARPIHAIRLGECIRLYMASHGMSALQLAEEVGINHYAIKNLQACKPEAWLSRSDVVKLTGWLMGVYEKGDQLPTPDTNERKGE